MTIIEDKLESLQDEFDDDELLENLFYDIHDMLERGLDYDEIFKKAFILNDEDGIILSRHISHAMTLIRDYTTQGKVFYPYFEKRWFKTPVIDNKLFEWEVPNDLPSRLVNALSRIIIELNNTTFNDKNNVKLAESIAKIKVYERLIDKYISFIIDDNKQFANLFRKFRHYYFIKLDDVLELEQVEAQLERLEFL